MCRTREENAEDLRLEEEASHIGGVCKDCGNGTLNNELIPAFGYYTEDDNILVCDRCGSTHLDIIAF